ncbi:MAG TPA: PDZ domain-containing protein [Pyrinomonadaceae bacterium]|nr:PDZ domain-containing protein [Pyrinomonadaceae bacterium]
MKSIFNKLPSAFLLAAVMMSLTVFAFAQNPAPAASTAAQTPGSPQAPAPERTQPPRTPPARTPRRPLGPPARVTVIADKTEVAPQVVTIVHRLSGLKMLRFLLRQEGDRGTLFTIDRDSIMSDAHASIIAGWALDDGKTIVARLPQAGAEIEFTQFPQGPMTRTELTGRAAEAKASGAATPPVPGTEADLTVITRDGRRLRAHYIGLDGQTGLSVLQVNATVILPPAAENNRKLAEGQRVQVFAPQRTTPEGEASTRIIYVRVSKLEAKISKLARRGPGKMDRLTVSAAKLSPEMVGGVACDELGNTLGIVEAIEGNDAQIVSAETIRAATRRVLARQNSVPRPLLGVRGEPLEFAARSTFLQYGWNEDQLGEMIKKQVGILLTSVMPGSPASVAKLKPGDVIVSVNQEDIASAEEFSKLLSEAGGGKDVRFTVRRPTAPSPILVDVKLGSSFEPLFKWHFEMPMVTATPNGLQQFGVETMALSNKMASQLGAQGGLLVVSVQPQSLAARAGLREGDVIETIDGRVIGRGAWTFGYPFNRQKKHVVSLVREREKKQIVLEAIE